MKTIAIPRFTAAPGQKGLYNRQEVGLARALRPWAAAPWCCTLRRALHPMVEIPEPNVKIYYTPGTKIRRAGVLSSWQVLLDEQVDAVHVMGDTPPACRRSTASAAKHGILFYSQLGALKAPPAAPPSAL